MVQIQFWKGKSGALIDMGRARTGSGFEVRKYKEIPPQGRQKMARVSSDPFFVRRFDDVDTAHTYFLHTLRKEGWKQVGSHRKDKGGR